jgi:putative restriction endonuclease
MALLGESNFWVFKTVADEDRSYRSIRAYDDDLSSRYDYDSNVPNSRQVQIGDTAVIVDKENILAFAVITDINTSTGTKQITKCPECGSTNYEPRVTKKPKYRCNHGHEFKTPNSTIVKVTQFQAIYRNNFISIIGNNPVSILRPYYSNGYNRNLSIQKIAFAFFEKHFQEVPKLLIQGNTILQPTEALMEEEGEYTPNNNDERENIARQIKARRGQAKFRNNLIKRYGRICMISGCEILDILEAAHINPYKGDKDNHVSNGLLLRSDLHTLFDLNLIGIDPQKLAIDINYKVRMNGYEEYHGQFLKGCNSKRQPSKNALEIRWGKYIDQL